MNNVVCKECDGYGYTAGHDPHDPHENGCTNCPIQVPCEACRGEGITIVAQLKIELADEFLQRYERLRPFLADREAKYLDKLINKINKLEGKQRKEQENEHN